METFAVEELWQIFRHSSNQPKVIIGFAGKKASGKSTIATLVASRLHSAVIAPLSAALKGSNLFNLSLLAFKPQWAHQIRQRLQESGMRGRQIDEDLWINAWLASFSDAEVALIPDVRFTNEVDFIHRHGGTVIYLNLIGAEYDAHPSEQLPKEVCDYVVDFDENTRLHAARLVISYLTEKYPQLDWSGKPKIYISSNVAASDDHTIFNELAEEARQHGFIPLIPPDLQDHELWINALATKSYRDACREIIINDLKLLNEAHVVLIYMYKPSIGCTAEMLAASIADKITIVVAPLGLAMHPWVFAFATKVFWDEKDRRRVWETLRRLFLLEG